MRADAFRRGRVEDGSLCAPQAGEEARSALAGDHRRRLRARGTGRAHDAETKAAKRLERPAVEVAVAALGIWGHSLSEERDRRVAAVAPPDSTPRSVQALRGRVTRELVAELAAKFEEVR